MNITVRQLVSIHQSLVTLSKANTCIWYAINKNLNKTKKEYSDYVEVYSSIIDLYCQKDFEGEIAVDNDNNPIFETAANRKSFEHNISIELNKIVNIEFYTIPMLEEFKKESHAANLIEPLIDVIIIE